MVMRKPRPAQTVPDLPWLFVYAPNVWAAALNRRTANMHGLRSPYELKRFVGRLPADSPRWSRGGTSFLLLKEEKMAESKLTWSNLGPIRLNMALDHIPKQAGVYKLTLKLWGNTYTYIGEAGARGLRARIGDYANRPPTEGSKAERLVHDLLKEASEADLSVCCTGLTLDEQKARRRFGKEAIAATQQERLMCLNTGGYPVDLPMRRFQLQSEQEMLLRDLERVRTKLAKLG
jgi:hypothetical protein